MIEDVDKAYRSQIERVPRTMEKVYQELKEHGRFPLDGTEVTRAVLLRLASYYKSQKIACKTLGKNKIGAGSDFFVETILFFTDLLRDISGLDIEVRSESDIRIIRKGQKGATRPDISIWMNGKLKVAIECKTQLGFNRDGWQKEFEERERKIHAIYPSAKIFLLVMTSAGFIAKKNREDFLSRKDVGKKIFVLSEVWPDKITYDNVDEHIIHSLESLFVSMMDVCNLPRK